MKNKKTTKAVLITSGVFLIIIGIMIYLYLKDPERNYLYYEGGNFVDMVIAKKDIQPGEVIDDSHLRVIKIRENELVNKKAFASNVDNLIGKKALYPIKNGQILPLEYFLPKEKWYENGYDFAIEVDVPTTVANSICIGDYIDINVAYGMDDMETLTIGDLYVNFDVVISKVLVEDIKDANGVSIKNSQEGDQFVPQYLKVCLSYEQIDNYLGAKKEGTIFTVKYEDPTSVENKVTFKNSKKNINAIQNLDTNDFGD